MGRDFWEDVSAQVGGFWWGRTSGGGVWEEAPEGGRYLELPQLLQLAAQVTRAVLQATQVQLHLQAADGSGLSPRGAAGCGWGRAGHWGGPAAPAA